jgi:hypothetical protein
MKGMQLQLFDDLPIPPRPSQYAKEVNDAIVERITPDIVNWICHGGDTAPGLEEIDDIKTEIFSAIEYEEDPYGIAKSLEYAGWDSDGELVHILDNVGRYRYEAYKDHVYNSWILKHGVVPKFSIGDSVVFAHRGRQETGEVIRVYPEMAQYTIHCPQHGHIKKGVGTHGHIINFEDCSKPHEEKN